MLDGLLKLIEFMSEIIPSILEKSYKDIEDRVRQISNCSSWVQVDVVDGQFVPFKTWPFLNSNDEDLKKLVGEEVSLPEWESVSYEFDLMCANPRAVADTFVMVGASRIIVHYSSFKDDHEREVFLRDFKKKYNLPEPLSVELGLAVGTDISIEEVIKYKDAIDFIQVMGIENVGQQGEKFVESTYDRIKKIKELAPDLIVSVDGGVKEEHLQKLLEAGVDRICMGSQIWRADDPVDEYIRLSELV